MRLVPRAIEKTVKAASRGFPAIVITGPRRAGKATLLRALFPDATYVLLEDPEILRRVREDPQGFLDDLKGRVVLEEIQNAPELLAYVRARIDQGAPRMGRWFFTGSQEFSLMRGVTESMAGRAAILNLLPFSTVEDSRVEMLSGGFPEVLMRPRQRSMWFQSYLQTYLERDVRGVTNVSNLSTFRKFMGLLASRHGQMLNRTDLAAPLGVAVTTIGEWLNVLEVTSQILVVPPYFENFGKRVVKSPKLYFADSGLACHLLGIQTPAELERSPFLGAIFEGFVAAEILKHQVSRGGNRALYYFRDRQGLEVDFVLPRRDAKLWLIECKASRTVYPSDASSLEALAAAMKSRVDRATVVHRSVKTSSPTTALTPRAKALDVSAFIKSL